MKLVILSDTHCNEPELPDGDILIHCGDHTFHGRVHETIDALNWLSTAGTFKHRICIAGNHEVGWQNGVDRWIFSAYPRLIYLRDSQVNIDGVKFWGSPVQPLFFNWAFQKQRGEELKRHWAQIPDDTDVLITHGPPKGFGDTNKADERFGDEDLLNRVLEVKPKLHCYGHAHHGSGEYFFQGIHFVNAAVLSEEYQLTKEPIVVDLDVSKR